MNLTYQLLKGDLIENAALLNCLFQGSKDMLSRNFAGE